MGNKRLAPSVRRAPAGRPGYCRNSEISRQSEAEQKNRREVPGISAECLVISHSTRPRIDVQRRSLRQTAGRGSREALCDAQRKRSHRHPGRVERRPSQNGVARGRLVGEWLWEDPRTALGINLVGTQHDFDPGISMGREKHSAQNQERLPEGRAHDRANADPTRVQREELSGCSALHWLLPGKGGGPSTWAG